LIQFAKWIEQQVNFVCRLKKIAVYELLEVLFEQNLHHEDSGILKEEHIHLNYKEADQSKELRLRKVTYRDDKGRVYEFIANNFEISREGVAYIYKLRWNIELLFKKLKQNFQLHYFYLENENGIKIQIWCRLIAQLLVRIL
jgi:IS4 transposase